MTGKTVKVLKIKIQKVTNDEKKEHYCSGDIKGKKTCKNPVKFRWSGGFYFCKGCHYNELEEYETDEEDSSSEEESSSSEEEGVPMTADGLYSCLTTAGGEEGWAAGGAAVGGTIAGGG